jgi:hypothetical protein
MGQRRIKLRQLGREVLIVNRRNRRLESQKDWKMHEREVPDVLKLS